MLKCRNLHSKTLVFCCYSPPPPSSLAAPDVCEACKMLYIQRTRDRSYADRPANCRKNPFVSIVCFVVRLFNFVWTVLGRCFSRLVPYPGSQRGAGKILQKKFSSAVRTYLISGLFCTLYVARAVFILMPS